MQDSSKHLSLKVRWSSCAMNTLDIGEEMKTSRSWRSPAVLKDLDYDLKQPLFSPLLPPVPRPSSFSFSKESVHRDRTKTTKIRKTNKTSNEPSQPNGEESERWRVVWLCSAYIFYLFLHFELRNYPTQNALH